MNNLLGGIEWLADHETKQLTLTFPDGTEIVISDSEFDQIVWLMKPEETE